MPSTGIISKFTMDCLDRVCMSKTLSLSAPSKIQGTHQGQARGEDTYLRAGRNQKNTEQPKAEMIATTVEVLNTEVRDSGESTQVPTLSETCFASILYDSGEAMTVESQVPLGWS